MTEDADRVGDATGLMLGRLEGRLGALEDRMGRYEATNAARLGAIEQKLDVLASMLAQGLGGMRVAHWIGGGLLALSGFFANHIWQRN